VPASAAMRASLRSDFFWRRLSVFLQGFWRKRCPGRGFFVVNLWWIRGELWCVGVVIWRLKNLSLFEDLFLRDSRFGNGCPGGRMDTKLGLIWAALPFFAPPLTHPPAHLIRRYQPIRLSNRFYSLTSQSQSFQKPPQGNDAKCGFACHTAVKSKDYVFTDYGHR
jgi:hypothetical protein